MLLKAQKLHVSLIKTGLQNHVYQCNLLLQSYIQSGNLSEAHKLLRIMPHTNTISYNTLISGFIKSHRIDEALKLSATTPNPDSHSSNIIISGLIRNQRPKEAITHFIKLRQRIVRPDNFTYAIIIPCCGCGIGRQVHSDVVKRGFDWDVVVGTNLLRMYAQEGEIRDAREVFDGMSERDLVVWNALISCYSKLGMGEMSLGLFRLLFRQGVLPDEFTCAIILNEFASRLQVFGAMQVHSMIIRCGFCLDRFTSNSLLNLYTKCGYIGSATRLFGEMSERDVVSWTAMIVGFLESGCEEAAMLLFQEMRLDEMEPNSFTFGSLLKACASASGFEKGKQFHGLIVKFGLEANLFVGSAMVDMYSNCGEMNDAFKLFQSMPDRDIVSWNGMICGFAQNGEGMKALELFELMVQSGSSFVAPNDITFVGVLSACSHCGLVKEGRHYFNSMIHHYMIQPKVVHYTCMVDILARAGLLDEAEALVLTLPPTVKPDSLMWGALLGGCKLHGDRHMARRIAEKLFVAEPDNSSNYVLLANTYTDINEWDDALEVRNAMEASGAQKTIGCSWI